MKLPLAFMLGCALLLPPVVRASSFEGTVEMKMTSGNQAASKMDFHIKAGCSRIDIEREGAPAASVIMDRADSRMIFLMPAQRMYLIRPWPMAAGTNPAMGRSGGGEGKGASLQVTTSREKILGYDTVKYVVTSK
ncbi:MAG: DUF4412 domain-containing protein, partial [Opitutaceae bacterium]